MRTGMRFVVAVACVLGLQAVVSCVDVEERTSRFCREHPEICDADAGAHDAGDAGDAGPDGGVDAGDAGPDGGPDAGDAGPDGGPDAGRPRWDAAGTPNTARTGHTATLLADGRVLVVGGFSNASGTGALTSVELYDPRNGGSWTSLPPLQVARGEHTATLISGGKVLVVGGRAGATPTKSVELYDPASGTSPRPDLPISARASHGAVLLPDGDEVLVMGGGANGETGLGDSARYAVFGGTWSTGSGSMRAERNVLSVTMVLNRVFAVGGYNASRTEGSYDVYTPGEGWSVAGGPLLEPRHAHAAAVIGQGEAAAQLLITGGKRGDGAGSVIALSSTELIPTEEGSGNTPIPMDAMFDARFAHTATTLKSGDVLVVGGSEADYDSLSTVELFDSNQLEWVLRPALPTARAGHTATLLDDGSVLVIGGHGSNGAALKSAERYWP
ncbi:galactose oxidase [Myxococcus sp. MISCRS1]|uniref:Kelch repeat-containing protein n=1 Tax=Myxococcus TaxID=32 RepID=UPI001CBF7EDC|nr:kelch repeat-containing protein [Myxococcus sp. MISCRS1]MBZ4413370.1 galactose oxidase [Myxococcus sp. XM-1-1-1]MCY0999527.1 galactose oxidase [Myxococcus sp. MISCRS1]BDT38684.1 galactose oxidase [Myxococcus sp. MH1]